MITKMKAKFSIQNVMFAATEKRLNWLPFTGTCLFADVPSDGIPSGGIDKPVMFSSEELKKSVDTMVDMGVDCEFPDEWYDSATEMFSGHDDRFKIGVVKKCNLQEKEVVISGGLWSNDFPDVIEMYDRSKKSLGFSVEVYFDIVNRGEYYEATNIEFTGVAILFSDLAAFKDTYIAASKRGGKGMDEKQLKACLAEALEQVMGKVENLNKEVESLTVAFAEEREARKKEKQEKAELAEKLAKEQEEKAKAELEEAEQKAKEEKEKAELAEKQAKEEEEKRKSQAFGGIVSRFSEDNEKILKDNSLSPSQKFQKLISENYK